jgi:hypothetical protein
MLRVVSLTEGFGKSCSGMRTGLQELTCQGLSLYWICKYTITIVFRTGLYVCERSFVCIPPCVSTVIVVPLRQVTMQYEPKLYEKQDLMYSSIERGSPVHQLTGHEHQ